MFAPWKKSYDKPRQHIKKQRHYFADKGLQGDPTSQPKGKQLWMFIGRTDAEAEAPIVWSPDAKNWLTRKDPDDRKDWRREEKGTTEDKVVGWHHWLRHKSEQAPGVGDGQGSLACYSPWGCKELDTTKQLNWTDLFLFSSFLCWTLTA